MSQFVHPYAAPALWWQSEGPRYGWVEHVPAPVAGLGRLHPEEIRHRLGEPTWHLWRTLLYRRNCEGETHITEVGIAKACRYYNLSPSQIQYGLRKLRAFGLVEDVGWKYQQVPRKPRGLRRVWCYWRIVYGTLLTQEDGYLSVPVSTEEKVVALRTAKRKKGAGRPKGSIKPDSRHQQKLREKAAKLALAGAPGPETLGTVKNFSPRSQVATPVATPTPVSVKPPQTRLPGGVNTCPKRPKVVHFGTVLSAWYRLTINKNHELIRKHLSGLPMSCSDVLDERDEETVVEDSGSKWDTMGTRVTGLDPIPEQHLLADEIDLVDEVDLRVFVYRDRKGTRLDPDYLPVLGMKLKRHPLEDLEQLVLTWRTEDQMSYKLYTWEDEYGYVDIPVKKSKWSWSEGRLRVWSKKGQQGRTR